MTRRRLELGWVCAAALMPLSALACGNWFVSDGELGLGISFKIHTAALVQKGKPERPIYGVHGRHAAELYAKLPQGRRLEVREGALWLDTRKIGHFEGRDLEIAKVRYVIDVTPDVSAGRPDRFRYSVQRAGLPLLSGQARPLCLEKKEDVPSEQEIRRRLELYLAWRETVATKRSAKRRSPAPTAP